MARFARHLHRIGSYVDFIGTNRCLKKNPVLMYHSCKPVKLAYNLFEPKTHADNSLSPLIFLHGLCFDSESTWDDLPQTFADQTKRKVYTLDARNHGDSEWSDEFDFDLNVEDFLKFIDEMSFQKAIIVGHCMGAMTGIKAAMRAPKRIELLFLEEVSLRKVPQFLMDKSIQYISKWKETEKFIPPGISKKDADKFITEHVLSQLDPETRLFCNLGLWKNISYPLRKDPSGRYVFNVNLDVLLEKMKNMDAIMKDYEGIYEGLSYFLYSEHSPLQIEEEKSHILQYLPKAVFVPFDFNKHCVHKEFSKLFVETVVKFIKLNEKNQCR